MLEEVITVAEALARLDEALKPLWPDPPPAERVPLLEALGRIVAEDIHAPQALPGFNRSTMDGYAVRAQDTYGASDGLPALLQLKGHLPMGQRATEPLGPGEAIGIATGGMLPPGADGVVMVEYAQELGDGTLEVFKGIVPGENILLHDEDLREGERILAKGWAVQPADLGALAGVGILDIPVVQRPHVGIISTGDEIVPPQLVPEPGQVRDINSYALAGAVLAAGGTVELAGIVEDDYQALQRAVEGLLPHCQIILLSGGSSVGTRDHTAKVIASLGEVLVHGVAVRPGKPTIIGTAGKRLILGLPGHPVSAGVIFSIFGGRAIDLWFRRQERGPQRKIQARINRNFPSAPGREDYVRVLVEEREDGYWAQPILAQSGAINSLVQAHGLLKIPASREGYRQGDLVEVLLF
ncbi:MAG: gephyrin-like molybdotransferase Glp [Limnochordia bacterium]|jgi:molybdopterin molybdotransferase